MIKEDFGKEVMIAIMNYYVKSDRKPTQTVFPKKGHLLIYVTGKFKCGL